MSIKGLAPHTEAIFEHVSKLECIKPYILAGGTALVLQLDHRKSEDLDFMKWRTSKSEKMEVDWPAIEKELKTVGEIKSRNILDRDHVEFNVSGVKFSFYASGKRSPVSSPVDYLNNIRLADIPSIMAMKIEVLMRRNAFRDYYDIYSILKTGFDINQGFSLAGKYSNHLFKTKNMYAILAKGDNFIPDAGFKTLDPKYDITSKEIEEYIKNAVTVSNNNQLKKEHGITDILVEDRAGSKVLSVSFESKSKFTKTLSQEDILNYNQGNVSDVELFKKYYLTNNNQFKMS